MRILRIANIRIKKYPYLGYFFVFAIGFIIFLYVLIPPGIIGPDSFYHTKMALLIKEQGLIQNFPWTQFTTYKDLFVDHHFAYHYLLIPFLSIPSPQNLDALSAEIDPLIKAKLATAFFAALVFVVLYWFLKRFKIKGALLWTLLAFFLAPFLLRLSLIRAPSISLILLILGIYFIIKRKYILLFLLSFIYVWTYGAWPLMLVTVIIYCFANSIKTLTNQWPQIHISKTFFNKINIKLLFACTAGLASGLIINPYFPKTLPFYWFQTVKIAMVNYNTKIGVGAEWYPFDPSLLITSILPLLIFWLIAISWFITKIKKQNTATWFFAFLSIFFLLYSYKAQRNIEYFIPPALFLSAFISSQIRQYVNWNNIKNHFKKYFQGPDNIFYFLLSIFFIVFIGFFTLFYFNLSIVKLHTLYKQKRPINQFQLASQWLKNNTEESKIVFQSDWDIFPQLFYFNTRNYYINGLDQTFMYEYNKELYAVWENLVSGKINPNNAAQTILEKFNAHYILIDKEQDKTFKKLLKKSSGLEKMYEDREAIIYKVL